MKARPILMSGPLVRALLEDRKTQTRRPVKPQPDWLSEVHSTNALSGLYFPIGALGQQCGAPITKCPYGKPGDLLWVRETWSYWPVENEQSQRDGILYRADDDEWECRMFKWRPSIFMPRWASRITLRLTDVRVERLQAISGVDAKQEGISAPAHLPHDGADLEWARREFFSTWQRIHGKAWRGNPWVWALSFEVIQANVDSVLKEQAA